MCFIFAWNTLVRIISRFFHVCVNVSRDFEARPVCRTLESTTYRDCKSSEFFLFSFWSLIQRNFLFKHSVNDKSRPELLYILGICIRCMFTTFRKCKCSQIVIFLTTEDFIQMHLIFVVVVAKGNDYLSSQIIFSLSNEGSRLPWLPEFFAPF